MEMNSMEENSQSVSMMEVATPSPMEAKKTSAMNKHRRERIRYHENI